MGLRRLLHQPYPLLSFFSQVRRMAIIGGFVFVFLALFEPFGINVKSTPLLIQIAATYGLITFVSGISLSLLLRQLFARYLLPENWNLGKELLITAANIFIIGCANLFYSNALFNIQLTLYSFFVFQFYTLLVGVFPVFFLILVRFSKLLGENSNQAAHLSSALSSALIESKNQETIRFSSELKNDDLILPLADFIFAESADNYVMIHYLIENEKKQKLIRNTLSQLEKELADYNSLVRCHRAYFVNLLHVKSFSGNAQGLMLQLRSADMRIPVARKMVQNVKSHLSRLVIHP